MREIGIPEPDIVKCSICKWSGSVVGLDIGSEGDYENGYYDIYLCPECEDGGSIDYYGMSTERLKEWEAYEKSKLVKEKLL